MKSLNASVIVALVAAGVAPARAADNKCEEIRAVGTLQLETDPHRPERLIDIFWSDPEAVAAHNFSWQTIAETLVSRYECGQGVTPRTARRALANAGDKCSAERAAVINQLVSSLIKQGVEATWKPTRTLWRCEQRLARKAAKAAPPAEPLSARDRCMIDYPPSVCDSAGLF